MRRVQVYPLSRSEGVRCTLCSGSIPSVGYITKFHFIKRNYTNIGAGGEVGGLAWRTFESKALCEGVRAVKCRRRSTPSTFRARARGR